METTYSFWTPHPENPCRIVLWRVNEKGVLEKCDRRTTRGEGFSLKEASDAVHEDRKEG